MTHTAYVHVKVIKEISKENSKELSQLMRELALVLIPEMERCSNQEIMDSQL